MGNPAEIPSLSVQTAPSLAFSLLMHFKRWTVRNGLLCCQPLPLSSRVGQSTHWVSVNYPSLKTKSVPWDVMDKFSKHWPVTSAMGSNLLGGVSVIWRDISICWWRPAAFLIFYWPLVSTLIYVLLKYLNGISRYLSFTVGKQKSRQVMQVGRNHLHYSHYWFWN